MNQFIPFIQRDLLLKKFKVNLRYLGLNLMVTYQNEIKYLIVMSRNMCSGNWKFCHSTNMPHPVLERPFLFLECSVLF